MGLRFGDGDGRLRLIHPRLIIARIEAHEHLPGFDVLIQIDEDFAHASRHFGGDRRDVAVHLGVVGRFAVAAVPPEVARHQNDEQQNGQAEPQQFALDRGGAGSAGVGSVGSSTRSNSCPTSRACGIRLSARHIGRHRDFSPRSCEFLSGMPTRRALLITPFAFAGLMALSRHRERAAARCAGERVGPARQIGAVPG